MELNNENLPVADNQVQVVPGNNVQDQDLPIVNIRPTDPIIGIFAEQHPPGSGKWNARMGGKPNSEWTGLQPDQVFKSTPFHYRRTEMTADSKGFLVRSTGLSTKFKPSDDVLQLQHHVWKHLTSHGLDTIAYLRDPTDSFKVIDVVRNHARFSANIKTTKASADLFTSCFDDYDQSNDAAAQAFLLDSLDPKLVLSLERKIKDGDGFVMMWLKLIQLVVVPSLDRWDTIKDKMKAAPPMDFAGQNVRELCNHFEDWSSTLRAGGQFDDFLTRTMVKNILKSKDLPAPFTLKLSNLQERIDVALSESTYMSPIDRWDHMADKELTFEDVCDIMASSYDVFVSNNEWPAAKLPSDSATVPSKYAHLSRHLLTLLQNDTSSNEKRKKKDVTCYNCGEKGHFANRCPNKTKLDGKGKGKSKSWKTVPPGNGDALVKRVKDNTFNWCGKCHRWTTTHTTATHTGKSSQGKNPSQASASLLEIDPSALCMSYSFCEGSVTREMKRRLEALAEAIPVALDSSGSINDHLCTIEYKLFEKVLQGPFKDRLERLEWKLDLLEDYAHLGLLENNDYPFPLRKDNVDGEQFNSDEDDPTIKRAKLDNTTSGWYNTFQKLYFFCAFALLLGPLRGLMWELCNGFGSSFLHLFMHMKVNWNNLYAPLFAPMSWMIAGYFGCCLSRPQPVSTIELASTYVPRHLRRNTKGMRRKQRKLERQKGHCNNDIDISGLGEFVRRRSGSHIHSKVSSSTNTFKQKPKRNKMKRGHFKKRHVSGRRKNQARLRRKCENEYNAYKARCHRRQKYNDHIVNMFAPKDICGLSIHMAMKAALHAPLRFRETMGKSDMFPIIWDSGASVCVTFDENDFLSLDKSRTHKPMKSISGMHAVTGEGYVLWSIPDTTGVLRHFKLKALWVPESQVRLLSTETLLQQYKGENIQLRSGELTLSGIKSDKSKNPVSVRVHSHTNLPTSVAYRYNGCEAAASALNNVISVVSNDNINLTDAEKELLRWHQRLGHISFKRVQSLFRSGVLSHTEATRRLHTAACKIQNPPKCAACQFGKQSCRPAKGNKSVAIRDRSGVLRQDNLLPGQCISVDHFFAALKVGSLLHVEKQVPLSVVIVAVVYLWIMLPILFMVNIIRLYPLTIPCERKNCLNSSAVTMAFFLRSTCLIMQLHLLRRASLKI